MKRRTFVTSASAFAGLLGSTDLAFAQAGGALGVVLMHGKQSRPNTPGLGDIVSKLSSAGIKSVAPTMPWSGQDWERITVTVDQVYGLIDGYVAALRSQGARRIVIAGQSLGANMALSYAVARQNVAAVAMLAPGHNPAYVSRTYPEARDALDKASALVASGQGNQSFKGVDDNQGSKFTISTTAAAYASWLNPRGPASMPTQALLLPASIPLLLVIGKQDPAFGMAENSIYRPAARNPYSKYIVVDASHRDTDFAASSQVVAWIRGLPG